MKAKQVTAACVEHGEGPFWDAASGRLNFVDLERGAVLAMTDGATVDRCEIGGVTAAIRVRREGGYMLAAGRGFRLLCLPLPRSATRSLPSTTRRSG